MDLLGDYNEDSDNESTSQQLVTQIPEKVPLSTNVIESNQQNKNKNGKKRKKLDISFLPENIQAALARGDTTGDSDSDQEDKPTLPLSSHDTSSSNDLLSKLPKPRSSDSGVKSLKQTGRPPVVKGETKATVSPPLEVNLDSGSDSDVDDLDTSILPHSQDISAKLSNPAAEIPPSIQFSPTMTLPRFNYTLPIPSISPVVSSTFSPHETPIQISNSSSTGAPQYQNMKSNHNRKRDREIETSLLRGDTSLMEAESQLFDDSATFAGAQLIDVQHNHEWDADYYYTQQKRQKELQSIFNFKQNGGDKMMAQPTKLQNKRHQINSLVMSAAESELELLEAKGRQMKTKYETQSKYGW